LIDSLKRVLRVDSGGDVMTSIMKVDRVNQNINERLNRLEEKLEKYQRETDQKIDQKIDQLRKEFNLKRGDSGAR
jgi:chaperonin cofactor prefoldin